MNKYIIVDIDLKEQILEFVSTNDDTAIEYVFGKFNPPPPNYNLYQLTIDTDKNWDFKKDARYIELPTEITEDGDYIFEG